MSAGIALPTSLRTAPLRPSFAGAVRAELLKIRRQAMTWLLLTAFAAVTAVVMIALVASSGARDTLAHRPGVLAHRTARMGLVFVRPR